MHWEETKFLYVDSAKMSSGYNPVRPKRRLQQNTVGSVIAHRVIFNSRLVYKMYDLLRKIVLCLIAHLSRGLWGVELREVYGDNFDSQLLQN